MNLNKVRVLRIKSLKLKKRYIKAYLEQKGKSIEELSINNPQETSQFGYLCPNLSVIDFYDSAQQIFDEVRNRKIQRLELKGNFEREAFEQFFGIKYSKLYQVSIENSESFSDQNMQTLLQNANNIQSLKLKRLVQLTNSSLKQIGNYGYNYEQISFIDLNQITHQTLIFIFQQCKRLKQIELAQLTQVNNQIFQVTNQTNFYLQTLKLTQLIIQGNQNCIDEIVQMRYLNNLQLRDLDLNDQDIVKILHQMTRLQTLDLCGNSITKHAFRLKDENEQPYPIYKSLRTLKGTFRNNEIISQLKRLKEKFRKIKIFDDRDQEIKDINLEVDLDW